jgi:heme/copper-type cytochrome/quinol oxidase subunit 2
MQTHLDCFDITFSATSAVNHSLMQATSVRILREVYHYNIIVIIIITIITIIIIIIITVINKIRNTSSLGNTHTKIHEKNTLFHKDSPTSIILQIML